MRWYLRWQAAQNWIAIEATISQISVIRETGDGPSSLLIRCSYEYSFNQRTYVGHRVSISGQSLEDGQGGVDVADELAKAYESHTPVTIWVNPENPEDSTILRNWEWRIPLLSVFGIICVVLSWLIPVVRRRIAARDQPSMASDHD